MLKLILIFALPGALLSILCIALKKRRLTLSELLVWVGTMGTVAGLATQLGTAPFALWSIAMLLLYGLPIIAAALYLPRGLDLSAMAAWIMCEVSLLFWLASTLD